MKIATLFSLALISASVPALAADYWPKGAAVYFIEPVNGATIPGGKVTVKFGLRGAGVAPAGVDKPGTGHHHLLIDQPAPTGADLENPLPADAGHRHYGGGQTETVVDLAPGEHTLQLIFGDQNHIPHDPPLVSEKIHILVK